jgi:hypothetical protein
MWCNLYEALVGFNCLMYVILSYYKRHREERENRSMRPILLNDIGQVGNKIDSGTVCTVHICVFNFTFVLYICLSSTLALHFVLFFILTFIYKVQKICMHRVKKTLSKLTRIWRRQVMINNNGHRHMIDFFIPINVIMNYDEKMMQSSNNSSFENIK